MGGGIYGYLSSIAVLCYLFMMMIFVNTVRDRIVNAFLLILTAMIFWTGGSFLMRLQMWPSYELWYHVSLGGLFLMIFSYFKFIVAFVGEHKKAISLLYLFTLGTMFLINIPTGVFLHWPNIIFENGKQIMVYDKMNAFVSFIFLIAGIIMVHVLYLLFVNLNKNIKMKKQVAPIVMGIVILFLGHLALLLPIFEGFPIDIVAGVINAGFLMYALIKRQLFKLKLMASETVGYMFCVGLGFAVFYSLLPFIRNLANLTIEGQVKYDLPIYLVSFVIIVSLLFLLWKKVIAAIFVKDEENQNDILSKFSTNVSKSLNLQAIFEYTVTSINEATGINKIYIAIPEHGTHNYILRYSAQSLADLSFVIKKDNPIVTWLSKNDGYLIMDEFVSSVEYKAMWEAEKLQLHKLGINYCIAFRENDELIGILLFSDHGRKTKLRSQDISVISSICTVASIAIKNAHIYEKAYLEARTDELTGVLNRRYFYELIHNEFERNKEGSLALIIINLDDFKLFNQLYGVKQGDIALKAIADIIKASIGINGFIARYSAKEFAILLPGYDVYLAKRLTESIRDQIGNIGRHIQNYRQKSITISAGISIAPFGAKSVKELLDNADHAVYQVKRKGKNAIKVFDTYVTSDRQIADEKDYANVYDEYKSTIYALTAAIDAKDHYTFNHSDNVAAYAVSLAKALSLNKDIIENIRQAALLHDIGKISIPERILNKPGKLSEEEYRVMQGHVEASIDIIRHLPSLDYVVPAVLGHHERYDGRGYPRRIAGEDIPLTARILGIADAFDAMISKRCYKPEIPVDQVLNILLEEAGRQFDPQLVSLFISLVETDQIKVGNVEKMNLSVASATNELDEFELPVISLMTN